MIKIAYFDSNGTEQKKRWWQDCLTQRLGPCQLVDLITPEALDAAFALVWYPPPGRLAALDRLQLIISLGQGVDHLVSDSTLPHSARIVRLVDPDMSHALSQWVILGILDHLRNGPAYRLQAQNRVFAALDQQQTLNLSVGVYGMGAIGSVIAARLHALGFDVHGWSRTARNFSSDITAHHGPSGFAEMLAGCFVHVCILPLTQQTQDIFDAAAFARMPRGSYFINAGRGRQVVEDDLLAAVRSMHLSGACLDVFVQEPLPAAHPFWDEPSITVWPHVAAQTNPLTAADQVAAAIKAVAGGQLPAHLVDRSKGY